ncbi:MAG: hypothetical protein HQ536_02865 [Parcubacteria group bacterium]|nr:hypothetical protein [Parcubacteria group bacterium]
MVNSTIDFDEGTVVRFNDGVEAIFYTDGTKNEFWTVGSDGEVSVINRKVEDIADFYNPQ